jgi:RNA polymerase sigma factor (sigma-70 family)
VRVHEGPLRRYLRRLADDEADDLAQEALLAAWRNLRQWRGEGNFAAWLRQIATRRFLDRVRRDKNLSLDPAAIDSPSSITSSLDQRIAVDKALAGLPPRERAAALLVFAEGHSHSEAAVILSVPLGTLKSLVARARARLIPLLEGIPL